MKVSGGLHGNGVVVDNARDKYGSSNPLVRKITHGFNDMLSELIKRAAPATHEVGCGEGFWVVQWQESELEERGCDFSEQVVDIARCDAESRELPGDLFKGCSIYDLKPQEVTADLVVCCEVLEP